MTAFGGHMTAYEGRVEFQPVRKRGTDAHSAFASAAQRVICPRAGPPARPESFRRAEGTGVARAGWNGRGKTNGQNQALPPQPSSLRTARAGELPRAAARNPA